MNNISRAIWTRLLLLCFSVLLLLDQEDLFYYFTIPFEWYSVSYKILSGLVWFMGALFLVAIVRTFFWEGIIRKAVGHVPPRLLMQLSDVIIYFLAFSGAMTLSFDQPMNGFLTASGALGIVIAFALRSLIMDTFSGLALHLESPFEVGHWIICHTRFGEYIGRVEETNWRTTRLWTTSRNTIIIPNSFLTTTIVTNLCYPKTESRFELSFTLDYSVPSERVIRVLTAAAEEAVAFNGILATPPAKVRIDNVSDHGVIYKIRYYINTLEVSPSKSRHCLIGCVLRHINYSGLTLAYPKHDLYSADMPSREINWYTLNDQITQLGKVSIFSTLPTESLEIIAKNMLIHELQQNDTVVVEGEAGDSMFIVAEGLLEVLVKDKKAEEIKVADLGPGAFFGEKSLLTGEPRSATVICATNIIVAEITKESMSKLFEQNIKIAEVLSRAIALRDIQNQKAIVKSNGNSEEANLEKASSLFLNRIKSFFRI